MNYPPDYETVKSYGAPVYCLFLRNPETRSEEILVFTPEEWRDYMKSDHGERSYQSFRNWVGYERDVHDARIIKSGLFSVDAELFLFEAKVFISTSRKVANRIIQIMTDRRRK